MRKLLSLVALLFTISIYAQKAPTPPPTSTPSLAGEPCADNETNCGYDAPPTDEGGDGTGSGTTGRCRDCYWITDQWFDCGPVDGIPGEIVGTPGRYGTVVITVGFAHCRVSRVAVGPPYCELWGESCGRVVPILDWPWLVVMPDSGGSYDADARAVLDFLEEARLLAPLDRLDHEARLDTAAEFLASREERAYFRSAPEEASMRYEAARELFQQLVGRELRPGARPVAPHAR